MATYSTNEFRPGLKVILDNEPCSILDNEFVKGGEGQAFNRVKLRNLTSGRVWERTFRSGESREGADVVADDADHRHLDDRPRAFQHRHHDPVARPGAQPFRQRSRCGAGRGRRPRHR